MAGMLEKTLVLAFMLAGLLRADPARSAALPTLPVPAEARLNELRFDAIGVNQIPQGLVSALAQDRAGFLWIGTNAGLMRYDGYSLRLQGGGESAEGTQGLGFIRVLLAARDGRLWIGTESDGLASYDPATERVSFFREGMGGANSAKVAADVHRQKGPAPTVRALAEDADGAVWVGSVGGGLDRFDPASGRFTHFRHSSEAGSLPDDRVQALMVDRQGTLWVGTWAGLSRRVKGSERFEPVFSAPGATPNLARRIVLALFEAADGRVWAGTQQGDLAVIHPALLGGSDAAAAQLLPQAAQAAAAPVYTLAEPSSGQIWVGRATGIELRDGRGDGHVQLRLHHDPRKRAGLAGNEVRALLLDRAGWLWVGGFGVGLQRHNAGNQSIGQRADDEIADSPLAESNVRSLLQLDNGEIWAGTNSDGVAVMDAQLRLIGTVWPGVADAAPLPSRRRGWISQSSRIGALTQAPGGSVWIGADSMLYEYSRERRLLRSLPTAAGSTRRLLVASDGGLWVGTQDGLFHLAPGANSLLRVKRADGRAFGGDVNALAEAADHGLWIGTDKGLFHIPAGASQPVPVPLDGAAGRNSMLSVVGLLIDSRQQLWLDTPVMGLHRLKDLSQAKAGFERVNIQRVTQGRAFGANLLEDGRGRIWSHQFVYDPRSETVDELTAADGADFGTGWFRAYAKTGDGRLLFGGSRGMLVITPAQFDRWSYAPPLVISALRVDGQPQPVGALQPGQPASGAGSAALVLDSKRHGFSLEFAALDFSDPTRCRYAYRLDGVDTQWIDTGADFRVASYSNLSPGDYTLRVRATNRGGVWSSHELAVAVRVLPAWWQSWWFRLGLVLGLIGVYFVLLQLRTRLLRRSKRLLEVKVRERTRELEALSLELEQSSLTDPLTGLRNRRFLTQHIEGDVAQTLRQYEDLLERGLPLPADPDLIFFLIDIDHFKAINDEHGHAAGDAVLMQMRSRLQPVFREGDHLVRWGGEEFLIVARSSSRAHAAELAERARAMVAETPFTLPVGGAIPISCSLGFACFPLATAQPRALDWSAVIALADSALFAAKAAGRNGWAGVLGLRDGGAAIELNSLQSLALRTLTEWGSVTSLQTVSNFAERTAAKSPLPEPSTT
ncbi:ligand-binding sensor domain-containing diguanylate cyclase [soil metagenome]